MKNKKIYKNLLKNNLASFLRSEFMRDKKGLINDNLSIKEIKKIIKKEKKANYINFKIFILDRIKNLNSDSLFIINYKEFILNNENLNKINFKLNKEDLEFFFNYRRFYNIVKNGGKI